MGRKQRNPPHLVRNWRRIPRSFDDQTHALDDHLFLLRENLHSLAKDPAYVKQIAAILRVLTCNVSGKPALLWRLCDQLGVADDVHVHLPGNVDVDHPLARGLKFALIPIRWAGLGDPRLAPEVCSLRQLLCTSEATFIGTSGLSHESLIRAVAEQIGAAHEDEGLEPQLADLRAILLNGVEPYIGILAFDGEMVAQVGERLLRHAEQAMGYKRRPRPKGSGDLTVILRFRREHELASRVPIVAIRSRISEVEIRFCAYPISLAGEAVHRGQIASSLSVPYPTGWPVRADAVFAFSYCSARRGARMLSSAPYASQMQPLDLGWVDARELREIVRIEPASGVYIQFIFTYGRLLSPKECVDLCALSPDIRELVVNRSPKNGDDPFPP